MTSSVAARRQLRTSVACVLLAAATLIIAAQVPALAPLGAIPAPLPLLGLLLLGAGAALHRPLGGSGLGLGSMVLPPALLSYGAVPAALVGAGALTLGELTRRSLERRLPQAPPERRRRLRVLSAAGRTALASLGAALAWLAMARAPLSALAVAAASVVAGAATYVGVTQLLDVAEGRLRRNPQTTTGAGFAHLALDAGGFSVGALLALAASPPLVTVTLGCLTLLSLEAARNALGREALERRVHHLESLGRAGQRISRKGSEVVGLVEQIRTEVRNVLPFSWLHLELLGDPSLAQSWRAGPHGLLEEGRPNPGVSPPPLPGIHRRSSWRLIDRVLAVEGRSLARLRLWCDPRLLEPEAIELLDLLLPQLAASVERSILDREAKQDALTGIPVRRVFEAELLEAYRDACGAGKSLSVILCDLDHFKRINDTYGHGAGDAALIHIGRILAASVRERDRCCRYGGEEFALLLRDTVGADALRLAERIRTTAASSFFSFEEASLQVNLSAGVAAFPELYVDSASGLLTLADDALYAAKAAGRNRCCLDLGNGRYRSGSGELLQAAPHPPSN